MNILKNVLKIVPLIGFLFLLSSCNKLHDESSLEETYELPNFKSISGEVIKSDLEFPSGLSYNTEESGTKGAIGYFNEGINGFNEVNKGSTFGTLLQGPRFRNLYSNGGIQPMDNPKILSFSGTLDNLEINSLAEFDLSTYFSDFSTFSYYALSDSLTRSRGLTLDAIDYKSGFIVSSNGSDKLFRVGLLNEVSIYMQNNELRGIIDMIKGNDGKIIYAIQSSQVGENAHPKRVISIDENKNIFVEFELPADLNMNTWEPGYGSYDEKDAVFLENLSIIENSPTGRKRFGNAFYISDQLEDVIYKIDTLKNISDLARGINLPTSLSIDSVGDLFYTTSPMTKELASLDITLPSALYVLNPETGESKFVKEFGEKNYLDYFYFCGPVRLRSGYLKYYLVPVGFNVSQILLETNSYINFLITNSHQGSLNLIKVEI